MSMFGVPYSPMVPSLTRWQSGLEFAQREQQVQRADHVVHLGEDRMFAVDHGIGRRALFGEMDDRFGFEGLDGAGEKVVVRDVADEEFDRSCR